MDISTSNKLKPITYNEIEKNTGLFNEKIQLFNIEDSKDSVDLRINIEKAFDTNDKVTKKFFDKFKSIHKKLQKGISGIDKQEDIEWYASVILNRLMFVYFLQKHFVIQNNPDFLLAKFEIVRKTNKDYFKDFLLPLFFYGFAKRDNNPFKQEFVKQYGEIRYLNGGLFYPHQIERKYYIESSNTDPRSEKYLNTVISIDAEVLFEILKFLNGYSWYLDNRPMKEDTDINPDVLGYIFEKYINQKELGAYYTKEDITEYIAKNTIIPFIFNKLRNNGFTAPDPTSMITYNEDIIGNMADYIEQLNDFKTLKFLYNDLLSELSVLDPSVGSGAFLFAALNILLPIYRKTVFKLKTFKNSHADDIWLQTLCQTLEMHSEEYYLTKHIILNNLYGVDIVEEAAEICKLRLFLQLASHLPDITSIEPLPDIDFNIYAGNSLVGGLSWEDLQNNYTMDLFTSANRDKIKENINSLSELKHEYKIVNEQIVQLAALKEEYKKIQQEEQNEERLKQLKDSIQFLEHEINSQIKVGIENPFHWFIEFDYILKKGGFDVIIGNPPYVLANKIKEYKVAGFKTESCGDLYGYMIERSFSLIKDLSYFGMIVPISLISTDGFNSVRELISNNSDKCWSSSYSMRPGKLFDFVDKHLCIWISKYVKLSKECLIYSTKYNRWNSEDRPQLFPNLKYVNINPGIIYNDSIPKIGLDIEKSILSKLLNHVSIGSQTVSNSDSIVYHTRKLRYFVQFIDTPPKIIHEDGINRPTSELKTIYFRNETEGNIALAAFCSTLFFWYYIVYSDCRNVNKREVHSFPLDFSKIDDKTKAQLALLSKELMFNLQNNSEMKLINYKKIGLLNVQSFKPRLSKVILDKIDEALARCYGFSKSELDFIINYDIKLRLGNDDSNDEEDSE